MHRTVFINNIGGSGAGVLTVGICLANLSSIVAVNNSGGNGGLLNTASSSVTIDSASVLGSWAYRGGVAEVFGGSVHATHVAAVACGAYSLGGAVSVRGGGVLDWSNSTVAGARGAFGGALYARVNAAGGVRVSRVAFSQCTAGFGGAVFAGGPRCGPAGCAMDMEFVTDADAAGDVTLRGVSVRGCGADSGGGVFVGIGGLVMTDAVVEANSATRGGGVFADFKAGFVGGPRVDIARNSAADQGGGIYTLGSVALRAARVLNNTAGEGGGGIAVGGGAPGGAVVARLECLESLVWGNAAGRGGGGRGRGGGVLVNRASYVRLADSNVTDNVAGCTGGGFALDGAAAYEVRLDRVTVTANADGDERNPDFLCLSPAPRVAGDARLAAMCGVPRPLYVAAAASSPGPGGGAVGCCGPIARPCGDVATALELGGGTVSIVLQGGVHMLSRPFAVRAGSDLEVSSADPLAPGVLRGGSGWLPAWRLATVGAGAVLRLRGVELSGAAGGGLLECGVGGALRVTGAVLRDVWAPDRDGGVVAADGCALSLVDVLMRNATGRRGGGVHAGNSSVAATRVWAVGMTAAAGGFLYADAASTVALESCDVVGARAGRHGGAVVATGRSTLRAVNCSVRDAAAGIGGGGVLVAGDASVSLSHSSLSDCTAPSGGAAAVSDARLALDDCVVTGGFAAAAGGGVYVAGGDVSLTRTLVAGCGAANGGGVAAAPPAVSVVTSVGVYEQAGSTVRMRDCSLARNTAGARGGAVDLAGAGDASAAVVRLDARGVAFDGNAAGRAGGAVACSGARSAVRVAGCTWRNSTAPLGGAASAVAACEWADDGSRYEGNAAAAGGAAACDGCVGEFRGAAFSWNTAAALSGGGGEGVGGALWISGAATRGGVGGLLCEGCVFRGNAAGAAGADAAVICVPPSGGCAVDPVACARANGGAACARLVNTSSDNGGPSGVYWSLFPPVGGVPSQGFPSALAPVAWFPATVRSGGVLGAVVLRVVDAGGGTAHVARGASVTLSLNGTAAVGGAATAVVRRGLAEFTDVTIVGLFPGETAAVTASLSPANGVAPLTSFVTVQACVVGERLAEGSATCARCPRGEFSWAAGARACMPCPERAVCEGGASLRAAAGAWRWGPESLAALECPNPSACPGEGAGGDACGAGYSGPLCAGCAPGAYDLAGACTECPRAAAAAAGLAAGLAAVTMFVVVRAVAALAGGADREEAAEAAVARAGAAAGAAVAMGKCIPVSAAAGAAVAMGKCIPVSAAGGDLSPIGASKDSPDTDAAAAALPVVQNPLAASWGGGRRVTAAAAAMLVGVARSQRLALRGAPGGGGGGGGAVTVGAVVGPHERGAGAARRRVGRTGEALWVVLEGHSQLLSLCGVIGVSWGQLDGGVRAWLRGIGSFTSPTIAVGLLGCVNAGGRGFVAQQWAAVILLPAASAMALAGVAAYARVSWRAEMVAGARGAARRHCVPQVCARGCAARARVSYGAPRRPGRCSRQRCRCCTPSCCRCVRMRCRAGRWLRSVWWHALD